MEASTVRKLYWSGAGIGLLAAAGLAFAGTRPMDLDPDAPPAAIELRVDVSERTLYVTESDEVIQSYSVAVGKPGHATPRGAYAVRRVIWNPRWVPPRTAWARDKTAKAPGDPDNPMGRVKIFFKDPDYYLHGTNAVNSLGQAASHGCVRLSNEDIIELAQLLMDHGEAPVEPNLVQRLINRVRQTKEVSLSRPVQLRVET